MSFNFTWSHPAEEVYVTGTFDNWSKSVKLDKKDQLHEKLVNLPPSSEKILYKFVADGIWQHDHTGKIETDQEGNLNNVLYPEDIKPVSSMAHTLSSVAPGASTTDMAGAQPLEKKEDLVEDSPPGTFPETPFLTAGEEKKDGLAGAGAEMAATSSHDQEKEQTFSVNPIPASEGAGNPIHLEAGQKVPDPSTFNSNTVTSTVHDDPSLKSSTPDEQQTLRVSPIPATAGIGNPVHLRPGEPVPSPSTLTGNTISSTVKLDQHSYEKADSGPPVLPPVVTPEAERTHGSVFLGLGPQTTNMIPESSMGMGQDTPAPLEGAAISSVAPTSTTAQLAGQVPLEPRDFPQDVPDVVTESQKEAGVAPEASANREAVQEKKEVENELKAKVPEEQAGSSNTSTIAGGIAGGLAAAGAAAVGAAAVVREKVTSTTGTDPVSLLPASVQKSVDESTKSVDQEPIGATAAGVPAEVQESQKEAAVAPEASANPEAVQEKSETEKELLSKVPESQSAGEPAPTVSAATTATAPVASADESSASESKPVTDTTAATSGAPQLADPTAGVAALSMDDKSKDLNASAESPAQVPAVHSKPQDSRDVSPMSKPATATAPEAQSVPEVTTGVDSAKVPTESTPIGTPRKSQGASTPNKRSSIIERLKGTPDSQKAGETGDSAGKKKGFFSKLKEKLKQ